MSPTSVSVNPTDGSCWVADYRHDSQVVHLSASRGGALAVGQRRVLLPAVRLGEPGDGSCWVADTGNGQVVHLSAAGTELWRSASGEFYRAPVRLGEPERRLLLGGGRTACAPQCRAPLGGRDGAVAVGQREFNSPVLRLREPDGWLLLGGGHDDNYQVVHLSAAGAELWRSASGEFCSPCPSR